MEPSLHPSSIPGLLVGQETQPTLPRVEAPVGRETQPALPVVDAAPRGALPVHLPDPDPAGGASTSARPPRPPSGRASSARLARAAPEPLEAAQVQASWTTLGLLVAASAAALVLAVVQGASPEPPPLALRGAAPVTRHVAAPPAPTPLTLDPTVFHHDVEPILKAECWSCHGEAGSGELRLRTGAGGVSLQAVLPFVAPGRPEASLLLRRPLGPAWGGPPHPDLGWTPESPQVQLLERWISGSQVPSRVTPQEAK